MKAREERRPVLIRARMRMGASWGDVRILNISSRGLMLHCAKTPAKGSYLELRRGRHAIVARVVWCSDQYFGVQTQDRLIVDSIIREPDYSAATGASGPPVERRSPDRHRLQRRHESSKSAGRAVEFACLAIAGVSAAMVGYAIIEETLTAPLAKATAALARK